MHVLGGPRGGGYSNVGTSLCIFHTGLYKYIEISCLLSPFSPFCSVLLAEVPAPLSTRGQREEMMSKSSPNCNQTHIHQLLDLLRYYRILQVSNEKEAQLEMRLNLREVLLALGASPTANPLEDPNRRGLRPNPGRRTAEALTTMQLEPVLQEHSFKRRPFSQQNCSFQRTG